MSQRFGSPARRSRCVEPALPLLGGAVRPRLGIDLSLHLLLDAVVADRGGRVEAPRDVVVGELLDVAGVDRVRRPTRPRSSRPAARAAPTTTVGPVEPSCACSLVAEQVLHVVAVLVRDHVRLRERPTARAELRLELVEEAEVDVHALSGGQ